MAPRRRACIPFILALGPLAAQEEASADQAEVVARWDDVRLTAPEFEAWLGHTLEHQTAGREGIQHLLQIQLVDKEAAARGLEVSDEEVDARLERIRVEAEANGFDLDDVIENRGLDASEFRSLIHSSLRHERLTRQDLEIPAGEPVTAEQQTRWSNARIAELMAEAGEAPPGVALEAGPFRISERELGELLRTMLEEARLLAHVEEYALQEIIPRRVRALGLELDDTVAAAELAWRDRETRARTGMSYEQLLGLQQIEVAEIIAGEQFRTACLLRLLAERRWDDAWFEALDDEQRAELEARYGEARLVHWMLLRSVDRKLDPLDLTHAEAAEELRGYRARVEDTADFVRLAGSYSEDETSRRQQGRLGWVHALDEDFQEAVRETAFSTPAGGTSEPVRVHEGMALVHVAEVRPQPEEEVFREEVRRQRHQELRALLLEEAGFQCVDL